MVRETFSEDEVSRIVQAFACAALDPSKWLSAMDMLCDMTGAVCCALELTDLNTGAATMECSVDLDTQVLKHYEERIFHINPRVNTAMSIPVGFVADDRHLMPADDPDTPEFRDWLRQTPYHFIQGTKVLQSDGHVGFFSSNYAEKHGPPDQVQTLIHKILSPHLINFVQTGRALSGNRLHNSLVNLDALNHERPFALVDRAGRLLECSAGFEAIMTARRILGTRDRTLVAAQARHRQTVQQFLTRALSRDGVVRPPLPIRLIGPNCRRGIVLRAVPIAPGNDIFDIFRPAALIAVTDLDRPQQVRRSELIALFGLTGREADVAALVCECYTTERASQELGISQYTVRQHLKVVFEKVGVTRQSELVSIISRLP